MMSEQLGPPPEETEVPQPGVEREKPEVSETEQILREDKERFQVRLEAELGIELADYPEAERSLERQLWLTNYTELLDFGLDVLERWQQESGKNELTLAGSAEPVSVDELMEQTVTDPNDQTLVRWALQEARPEEVAGLKQRLAETGLQPSLELLLDNLGRVA